MSRGINQFTTPKPNLEPSYELSYLLGVLKGDGCIYKTRNSKDKPYFNYAIQLAVRDRDFAEYFTDILEKIFKRRVSIITYYDDRNKLFYKAVIRSKSFYEWYNSKNETDLYEIASKFPTAFIKGVFDSEGSLGYDRNRPTIRIVSSDRNLILFLNQILSGFSIKSTINMRNPRETYINGRKCKFKRTIYVLGIYKLDHIYKFYDLVGTSIRNKMIGGD